MTKLTATIFTGYVLQMNRRYSRLNNINGRPYKLKIFAILITAILVSLITRTSAHAKVQPVCVGSPYVLEDNIALRVEDGRITHPLSIVAAALMVDKSGIREGWAYFDDFGYMHLQLSAKASTKTREYYKKISGFNQPDTASQVFGSRSIPFPEWISLRSCSSS